jgi:putative transposase
MTLNEMFNQRLSYKFNTMEFTEGQFYHIYNRGNNQQKIFFRESNYRYFLKKITMGITPYCEILTYCLMPNHFHLEIYVKTDVDPTKLNTAIGIVLRSYTRAIQNQENFKGSLFQQKTKAKQLDLSQSMETINQLAICMHYIHQNPYKAGLVNRMEDWLYSSFREYIGLQSSTVCNIQLGFEVTGIIPAEFMRDSYSVIPDNYLGDIAE